MPGIHALSKINDLHRAWAPAFAGEANKSAFPQAGKAGTKQG